MSGETDDRRSSWTVDTLKDHYDQRFNDQEQAVKSALTAQKEAVAAALAASEKAVAVAETNAEKWRQSANEWRGAMNDRERNLMPRTEAENASKANAEKINALGTRIDKSEGRTSGLLTIFAILSSLGVLVAIFMAIRRG